jgi:hypothetical protein
MFGQTVMIERIRRLLGWDTDDKLFEPDVRTPPPRNAASRKPAARAVSPRPAARPPTRNPAENSPEVSIEFVDKPALSLDTSAEAGFDPYNTGAYDRSASWDRISKTKGR